MSNIEDWLKTLGSDSPEAKYHRGVLQILDSIEFDRRSAHVGFGLLQLLSANDFIGPAIDTTTDPIAGSFDENSHLIAEVFSEVGKSPSWWKSAYPNAIARPEVAEKYEWWLKQFRECPNVTRLL